MFIALKNSLKMHKYYRCTLCQHGMNELKQNIVVD